MPPCRWEQGWRRGKCITREQVWCSAHPGKHFECRFADCRAEEIRLSLGVTDGTVEYGCPHVGLLDDLSTSMEQRSLQLHGGTTVANRSAVGPCVPDGDERAD
eukprot:947184-Prymnesium_polylepis.1